MYSFTGGRGGDAGCLEDPKRRLPTGNGSGGGHPGVPTVACLAVATNPSTKNLPHRKTGAGDSGRSTDTSLASIRILAAWLTRSRTLSDQGASARFAARSEGDASHAFSSSKERAASKSEFEDRYPPTTKVDLNPPSIVTLAADSWYTVLWFFESVPIVVTVTSALEPWDGFETAPSAAAATHAFTYAATLAS